MRGTRWIGRRRSPTPAAPASSAARAAARRARRRRVPGTAVGSRVEPAVGIGRVGWEHERVRGQQRVAASRGLPRGASRRAGRRSRRASAALVRHRPAARARQARRDRTRRPGRHAGSSTSRSLPSIRPAGAHAVIGGGATLTRTETGLPTSSPSSSPSCHWRPSIQAGRRSRHRRRGVDRRKPIAARAGSGPAGWSRSP